MNVAFLLKSAPNDSCLLSGRSRRRLLGLLRLLADFTRGPVQVRGAIFCYWMLERNLPQAVIGQNCNASIQQVELAFRARWQQECFSDWHWLGGRAINEISPDTEFMVIRSISPRIAESICCGMQKKDYLQCAFEVSRRNNLQNAIYFELVDCWYSIFSKRSVAYFVPYGADDDPIEAWRLRRLGFSEIRRSDDLQSYENIFLWSMLLIDEEANAKGLGH